jgi:hypothetical protein
MSRSAAWPDFASALERGDVVLLPGCPFPIDAAEHSLFSPDIVAAKNVSFDPARDIVRGTHAAADDVERLSGLLRRFSTAALGLVAAMCPPYAPHLIRARASFRPAEIAGRPTSWRHDDTRLHVDSFPATPSGGHRILRVFANVNPEGHARRWRIGEPFAEVARRFNSALREPSPLTTLALRAFGLTKTRRTPYDALMLQLHDAMKRDTTYQRDAPQTTVDFEAGAVWVAFTDQVSHAAMSGQYQLEQTLLLPVDAMLEPARSPLRILERLRGRRLA